MIEFFAQEVPGLASAISLSFAVVVSCVWGVRSMMAGVNGRRGLPTSFNFWLGAYLIVVAGIIPAILIVATVIESDGEGIPLFWLILTILAGLISLRAAAAWWSEQTRG